MDTGLTLTQGYFLFEAKLDRFIRITDGMTIGRHNTEMSFGTDEQVSREHLRFHMEKAQVFIEDLRSTNGTKVNGKKIRPNTRCQLQPNDILEFGHQKFTLVFRDLAMAAPRVDSEKV